MQQAKTLFASDMDGTLLNENSLVSPENTAILNDLIQKGLCFTLATARSPRSAMGPVKTSGFRLSAPAVCLNGALLWDAATDRPVKSFPLSGAAMGGIWRLIEFFSIAPRIFMQPSAEGILETLYPEHKEMDPAARHYMEVLASSRNPYAAISKPPAAKAVAVSFFAEPNRLAPLFAKAKSIPETKAVLYDSTAYENRAYLEIFSHKAGKGAGVLAAKTLCGAEKVVVFGDNFNDIDMYQVADQSYTPENGEPVMKEMATGVIPSNREGGVIFAMAKLFAGESL